MTTLITPEQIRTASLYPLATLAERTAGTIPIVVTRYFPRGLKYEITPPWPGLRYVAKLAPSAKLLRAYKHDEMAWEAFVDAYRAEMRPNLWRWQIWLLEQMRAYRTRTVTLLCHEHDAPEDIVHCHRRLLRELLLEQAGNA